MKQIKQRKFSSTPRHRPQAPPELLKLQQAITDFVGGDAKRAKKNHAALTFLKGDEKQNLYRLGLYRRGYKEKFENFLRSIFPGTFRLIPKKDQVRLLESFRMNHPSATYSLDDSASRFPEFIGQEKKMVSKYPAIAELLKFEWQLHLALQKKPPRTRRLIFKSKWNIVELWSSRCRARRLPEGSPIFLLNKNGSLQLHGK